MAATGQPIYAAQPEPVAGHYGVPYAARLRVQRNLKTLGVLWCLFAAYRGVAALFETIFLHAFVGTRFGPPAWILNHRFGDGGPQWMSVLLPLLTVVTGFSVVLSVIVGWSLLNRKPWARTLAIVAAVLALLTLPMGTALGTYTLWVMAPGESGGEWKAIADRS